MEILELRGNSKISEHCYSEIKNCSGIDARKLLISGVLLLEIGTGIITQKLLLKKNFRK